MADVSQQRKVLLIGWDAADWEHITPLVEEGLMPTLDAFINREVMGKSPLGCLNAASCKLR
jgi:predicted AlkP superfamily phosphohydrolase/phosphomutase